MKLLTYKWNTDGSDYELSLVPVPGTGGNPYLFGRVQRRPVEISNFYISTTPVTQALWLHVMGENPATMPGLRFPVENVSWNHISDAGGFLNRINSSEILASIAGDQPQMKFRLPSETEWEYAARGGPNWQDGFVYSGSNEPDEVAWYGPRWTATCRQRTLLFFIGLRPHRSKNGRAKWVTHRQGCETCRASKWQSHSRRWVKCNNAFACIFRSRVGPDYFVACSGAGKKRSSRTSPAASHVIAPLRAHASASSISAAIL